MKITKYLYTEFWTKNLLQGQYNEAYTILSF